MSWMILTLVSAGLLGAYDIAKKVSVRGNAVPIVLLVSVVAGAIVWTVLLIAQRSIGTSSFPDWVVARPIDAATHAALFAKAVLVGMSWTLAFFALKELPLSIAAPIRSTSPLWTLAIAVTFLGERPSPTQWLGIVVVLGSFWALSVVGAKEGIRFRGTPAVWWMIAATVLGAISSIYDKILLQNFAIHPATVQAWFSIYLVPVMIPLAWRWKAAKDEPSRPPFQFRVSILAISPLLLAADMAYFTALSYPDALVSVISPLRRASVIVAILLGSRMAGEVNLVRKTICVLGILAGVALLMS